MLDILISDVTTLSAGMIVFWVLLFALLVQLFYYLFFFARLARHQRPAVAETLPPVSVVICARNEERNLTQYLTLVLEQDYPEFEVVVVNDCSYDLTGDVLEEFAKKHKRLKIVTIKEDEYYQHGKKVAVMMGIKGSKYDLLVMTDADCRPASNQWLRSKAQHFTDKTEIVLGYGPYERGKGWLNKLIRFDTFFIGMQYLSYSLAGVTYMGVGRNLSYRKELFYRNKGFASHYHIPSGDDDLFVNEVAARGNTRIEIGTESFCYSRTKRTLREWWFQKRRHLETGKRYRAGHKLSLGLYVASQWLFFGCFIAALVLNFQPYVVLGAFLLRFSVQMITFNFTMKRLGERDLLLLAPPMEILLMLFYPVITFSRMFQRKRRWN